MELSYIYVTPLLIYGLNIPADANWWSLKPFRGEMINKASQRPYMAIAQALINVDKLGRRWPRC